MKRFFEKNKTRLIVGAIIIAALTSAFFFGEKLPAKEIPDISAATSDTALTVTADSESSVHHESSFVSHVSGQQNTSAESKNSNSSANDSSMSVSSTKEESKTSSSAVPTAFSSKTQISSAEQSGNSEGEETTSSDENTDRTDESSFYGEETDPDSDSSASSEDVLNSNDSDGEYRCTLTVNCVNALTNEKLSESIRELLPSDGSILEETEFSFLEGESPFTLLQRVCRKNGIPFEYSVIPLTGGIYVEGINNLYELDCGSLSGWMYSVNGEFPSVSCSDITLSEGDRVAFLYTCDLGDDVGNHYRGD